MTVSLLHLLLQFLFSGILRSDPIINSIYPLHPERHKIPCIYCFSLYEPVPLRQMNNKRLSSYSWQCSCCSYCRSPTHQHCLPSFGLNSRFYGDAIGKLLRPRLSAKLTGKIYTHQGATVSPLQLVWDSYPGSNGGWRRVKVDH